MKLLHKYFRVSLLNRDLVAKCVRCVHSNDRFQLTEREKKYSRLIRNEEDLRSIRSVLDDYDYFRDATGAVPKYLMENDVKRLMFKDRQKREHYLAYLCEHRAETSKKTNDNNGLVLFHNVGPNKVNAFDVRQRLVFDCSFEQYMNEERLFTLCTDLRTVYSNNVQFGLPFDIYFCNYNFNSKTHKLLMNHFFGREAKLLINFESKSYLDLFPKDNLRYLTRDTETNMLKYNHDDVFIIGAIDDYGQEIERLCLQKAKIEKIKPCRLPVINYVQYTKSQNFSIVTVHKILSTMKGIGDWQQTFKSVFGEKATVKNVNDFRDGKRSKSFKSANNCNC